MRLDAGDTGHVLSLAFRRGIAPQLYATLGATDYPHQDGFFPGAPQMLSERLRPLSPEAKHQVRAGGALGFYGLS